MKVIFCKDVTVKDDDQIRSELIIRQADEDFLLEYTSYRKAVTDEHKKPLLPRPLALLKLWLIPISIIFIVAIIAGTFRNGMSLERSFQNAPFVFYVTAVLVPLSVALIAHEIILRREKKKTIHTQTTNCGLKNSISK